MTTLSAAWRSELAGQAASLNACYAGAGAHAVIEAVLQREFPAKTAVVSSFGVESVVLLHLVAAVDPATPIIFLQTGRHFAATLHYRDALSRELGLRHVIDAEPLPVQLQSLDPEIDLARRDPDMCCHVRKTLPMIRALREHDCFMSGRKRFQTPDRSALQLFEVQDRWIKVNPLAAWMKADLDAYSERHGLKRHPLEAEGYSSVGCEPCTAAVSPDNAYREGRWAGREKTECGIHTTPDGRLVREATSVETLRAR